MTARRLAFLIAKAQGLANDHPCVSSGHVWRSTGGRRCPLHDDRAVDHAEGCIGGSQAAYECSRCGDIDYGTDPAGPGYDDCRLCPGRPTGLLPPTRAEAHPEA